MSSHMPPVPPQKGGRSPSRGGTGSILEASRAAEHFGARRHREHQAEYHEQGVLSRPPYEVKSPRESRDAVVRLRPAIRQRIVSRERRPSLCPRRQRASLSIPVRVAAGRRRILATSQRPLGLR